MYNFVFLVCVLHVTLDIILNLMLLITRSWQLCKKITRASLCHLFLLQCKQATEHHKKGIHTQEYTAMPV